MISDNHADEGLGRLSRRSMLITLGAVTAFGGIGFLAPSAEAAWSGRDWSKALTQNGWSIVGKAGTTVQVLEGSDASVRLRTGLSATVLTHVARRFHYEIATLEQGDIKGYRESRTVAGALESNYLSGTAIAIQPDMYPAGSVGNFFPFELLVIRDILAECGGVVRWGGDDPTIPKEGHFQIDVKPGDPGVERLAARISGWTDEPGQGAGAPLDLSSSARRTAARAMERRQSPGPDS